MSELDSQFNELVAQLSDMPNPDMAISIVDLNEALFRLNEAAMYLAEFLTLALDSNEKSYPIPQGSVVLLPALVDQCIELSESLHDVTCDACMDDDDNDDEDDE